MPERMTKKHVRQVAKQVDINLKGITLQIDADKEKLKDGFEIYGRADGLNIGRVDLFPKAFRSREELIRTLYHELVHVRQYREYGVDYVQNNILRFEDEAYNAEDAFIEVLKKEGRL